MNKFFLVLFVTLATLVGVVACDSLPFVALNDSTATPFPTRRIRPTFTPKPSLTPTDESTPTDEATDVPPATDVPADTDTPEPTDVPTKKPAAPPPAPKATDKPAPPPAPTFPVSVTGKHFCDQGDINEIVFNAKKGTKFVEPQSLWFGAFDTSGQLLQNGAGAPLVGAVDAISRGVGNDCNTEFSFQYQNITNGKLDVGDAVHRGVTTLVIRFIRSATDLTPLSPDIQIDFSKPGRYWMYVKEQ